MNLAGDFGEALREKAVVPGTRSDIAFVSGARTVILEVIVTHPPDERTLALYEEAGVELYTVKIGADDWLALGNLRYRVLSDQRGGRCGDCERQAALREREAAAERERERKARENLAAIESAKEAARAWVGERREELRREKRHSFTPKYQIDRVQDYGTPKILSERAGRYAFVCAKTLGRMGFQQSNAAKPWLFKRTVGEKPAVAVWAQLHELLGIDVNFFTDFQFQRCGRKHASRVRHCPSCEGNWEADRELSAAMTKCFKARMEQGKPRPRESAAKRFHLDNHALSQLGFR